MIPPGRQERIDALEAEREKLMAIRDDLETIKSTLQFDGSKASMFLEASIEDLLKAEGILEDETDRLKGL